MFSVPAELDENNAIPVVPKSPLQLYKYICDEEDDDE